MKTLISVPSFAIINVFLETYILETNISVSDAFQSTNKSASVEIDKNTHLMHE